MLKKKRKKKKKKWGFKTCSCALCDLNCGSSLLLVVVFRVGRWSLLGWDVVAVDGE